MRKLVNSRERILSASIELFSQEGFHGSKITKIADMTGISVGKIYLVFENKDRILEEIFLEAWSQIDERLKVLINGEIDNIKKLKEICNYIVDTVGENNNLAKLILQEHRFWNSTENKALNEVVNTVFNRISGIIKNGISTKEFKSDVNAELSTYSIIGSVWNVLGYWTMNKEKFDKEYISNQILNLTISSIKNH